MSKLILPLAAIGLFAAFSNPSEAQQRSNLGGGFIEYLATGRVGGAAAPQQPAPAFYPSSSGSVYAPPAQPRPTPVVTVAPQQVQPAAPPRYRTDGMPAYTGYGASPLDVPAQTPQAASQFRRGPDVAYAAPPRVQAFEQRFEKQMVEYDGNHAAGTIVIDTPNKYLYLVQGDGKALRYGIGVGRPGFAWAGVKSVTRKAEWPGWTPPPEMRKRRPDLPTHMEGGEDNPLGARALYLGSSLYRIHGTNEPSTIGQAVSSGCIRMRNQDVIDLYNRVRVGTKVIVI